MDTTSMWAAVAEGWGRHADDTDARGEDLTEAMLDRAEVGPGDRVLELACGPGGVGLAAAARVGPSGEVVLSDAVPEMTAIAAARAAERGLTNVRTAVIDLERIDEPDESYDAVVCREGLMFAADHRQAVDEIRRVLRPGGRAALAVWGPRDRNPWLGLVLDAVSAQLGMPIPPPGIPGPFELDEPTRVSELFMAAGLTDVSVQEVPVPLHADSFDAWWARTTALAGPVASIVEALPDQARDELLARVRGEVAPYEGSDGLDFPGVSLLAFARRGPG